jgi:Bifunctional DNA primase/polymerase, N-terminal/AAA domain
MTPLEFALEYIARGWAPIPIPHKSKAPLDQGWPGWRITKDTAHQWFNGEAQNVGVQLGEVSGGLADVDLDSIEAVRAGSYFLQQTLCFGRASKPRSHWLYQSELWKTEDRATIPFKFVTGAGKDRKEQMILELRIGGGGKGAQTVFPGSVHETGEPIAWGEKEDIARAEGDSLKHQCARTASAALLAGHFPTKGARHDAGLTLGGFLYRCGFNRPDTELFAEAVTIASGQPRAKVKDVRKAAREAWDEANRQGGQARGFPALAETFGDDIAKHVAKWLGFSGERGNARANGEGPTDEGYVPPGDAATPKKPPSRVIGAGTFLRSYAPISYTLSGILPSGYLYGLTAKQGSGKTAWKIAATIAVAMNRPDVIGCDVEPGRVAYVSIENPTDFKMKLAVNCYAHNISYDEIEPSVAIIDGRDTPEQVIEGLKLDAEENGPFQLICFDTFQAGFAAAGAGAFNDNEAVLNYVIRLRPLTTLPGSPSVLAAFHPTKNAGEGELIPYGGGSTYNEIDGNLTLWKEAQIKLYHNRLRGPEFEPKYFRIEMLSCPDIVDKQDRQILLPVMRPITETDAAEREKNEGNLDLALLRAMAVNPDATQLEWASAIGLRSKSAVNTRLQKLKDTKFVEAGVSGKWRLTPKGQKEAK